MRCTRGVRPEMSTHCADLRSLTTRMLITTTRLRQAKAPTCVPSKEAIVDSNDNHAWEYVPIVRIRYQTMADHCHPTVWQSRRQPGSQLPYTGLLHAKC